MYVKIQRIGKNAGYDTRKYDGYFPDKAKKKKKQQQQQTNIHHDMT